MFGIGFFEFILIAILVLLFVKPKDFPLFLRRMGILYRNLRRTYDETMDTINSIARLDSENDRDTSKNLPSSYTPPAPANSMAKETPAPTTRTKNRPATARSQPKKKLSAKHSIKRSTKNKRKAPQTKVPDIGLYIPNAANISPPAPPNTKKTTNKNRIKAKK